MEKESERRVSILENVLPSTASWQTRSPEVPIADACRGAWSQRHHNKNCCMPCDAIVFSAESLDLTVPLVVVIDGTKAPEVSRTHTRCEEKLVHAYAS